MGQKHVFKKYKITNKEADYILNDNQSLLEKISLKWELVEGNRVYVLNAYIKPLAFVLIFVPVCAIEAIWRIWDGGLKEFLLPTRKYRSYTINNRWEDYGDRMQEVKEKYKDGKEIHN